MTKRFIPKKELVDIMDPQAMKEFIGKILQQIDECQSPNNNPNLERLGHEVLRTAFEFGLVDINGGCPGCSGGCPSSKEKPHGSDKTPGKVIPFKKLH